MKKNNYPLVVDLDGTLVHSDLFVEAFLIFVGKNPFRMFVTVYWFLKKGRAYLKLQLEKRIALDIPSLPWNKDVISWLQLEKEKGRTLVLVTGTSQKYAEQVAEHLNLFSDVFGVCRARPRLTGKNKARFLFSRYGFRKFDYIANSFIDYPVWRLARESILAHAYPFVIRRARRLYNVVHIISKNKDLNFFKRNILSILKVVQNKVSWNYLLGRVLAFLSGLFYYEFIVNFSNQQSVNLSPVFHGFISGFLFFVSAFIWGELRNLHRERKNQYGSLFSYIHMYWGVVFIPLFWISMVYAGVTLPLLEGVLGAFIYFSLESVRFLFRKKYFFYEWLILVYLIAWGSILVF